jgi:small-conductance mechanosensitive channel
MAQLIKDQKQVTFQVGERVQFKVVDGTVSKMNKISVRIKGVDGNEYIATVKEVKKYIDPFA